MMKKTAKDLQYVKWLSAEDMHLASKGWLSELNFIKDEHRFFEDVITTFTSELVAYGDFSDSLEIIDAINQSEKQSQTLLHAIKTHESKLSIMVDGIDQIEEEKAYAQEHRDLIVAMTAYLSDYKSLKLQLFEIIKCIKKDNKNEHLLDRP
ncbi:MAG: hypothetical protein ABJQ39_10435 [Winogradskyella arenosi]